MVRENEKYRVLTGKKNYIKLLENIETLEQKNGPQKSEEWEWKCPKAFPAYPLGEKVGHDTQEPQTLRLSDLA